MVHASQLFAAAIGAGLASVGPAVYRTLAVRERLTSLPILSSLIHTTLMANTSSSLTPALSYNCPAGQGYRTEIVSLDPLLIYIHDFVSLHEAELIIKSGESELQPSPVTGYGSDAVSQARTSWSAPLPGDDEAVKCVLRRAETFLGTVLRSGRDDMGAAQLVHYDNGQKFDLHHDWFRQPRITDVDMEAGRRRMYNRVATFFVVLEANCTAGETYFPQVTAPEAPDQEQEKRGVVVSRADGKDGDKRHTAETTQETTTPDAQREDLPAGSTSPRLEGKAGGAKRGDPESGDKGPGAAPAAPVWRAHENGGLAFRPIAGNALFWVNLFANGTGDGRTLHAGLPVGEGTKTAMNIWPRAFFGPDA
ncbi:hypothetical protein SBRCBS47491_005866 [Sporothrix bragantina]|uniref:Prolyl 4-hydroxylase alpha subunit domain-containing protein n=1 Tax=Sporothrix bragantina TaxID=671064 RepID=A0ABP0C0J2_9PEZI